MLPEVELPDVVEGNGCPDNEDNEVVLLFKLLLLPPRNFLCA